jgi:hypothetical protein
VEKSSERFVGETFKFVNHNANIFAGNKEAEHPAGKM